MGSANSREQKQRAAGREPLVRGAASAAAGAPSTPVKAKPSTSTSTPTSRADDAPEASAAAVEAVGFDPRSPGGATLVRSPALMQAAKRSRRDAEQEAAEAQLQQAQQVQSEDSKKPEIKPGSPGKQEEEDEDADIDEPAKEKGVEAQAAPAARLVRALSFDDDDDDAAAEEEDDADDAGKKLEEKDDEVQVLAVEAVPASLSAANNKRARFTTTATTAEVAPAAAAPAAVASADADAAPAAPPAVGISAPAEGGLLMRAAALRRQRAARNAGSPAGATARSSVDSAGSRGGSLITFSTGSPASSRSGTGDWAVAFDVGTPTKSCSSAATSARASPVSSARASPLRTLNGNSPAQQPPLARAVKAAVAAQGSSSASPVRRKATGLRSRDAAMFARVAAGTTTTTTTTDENAATKGAAFNDTAAFLAAARTNKADPRMDSPVPSRRFVRRGLASSSGPGFAFSGEQLRI